MKNAGQWAPTKYVWRGGRLRASRDPAQVGVGSRLIADAVAACWQQHLPGRLSALGGRSTRLADLGCGRAPLYALYGPLVDDPVCVDWAQSLHDDPAASHLDRIVDLNQPLPFADASFDVLILSDVLEHLAEPVQLWAEMARILAPGGLLLLNVPFLYGIHEAPHDYARYTGHALRRFAERSGLRVDVLEAVGGSVSVFADLLGKHLQVIPGVGRPLAGALAALTGRWLRTATGRRVEARSATHFPLGYFMVAARPDSAEAPPA